MSNGIITQAADRRGPQLRTTGASTFTPAVICIAGTGASQNLDLESAATGFGSQTYQDRFVSISVESAASFWWYWSDSAASTVDKTATGNGATVGAFCPSGIIQDERPQGRYLVIQTSAAANIHVWLTSGSF